MSHIHTAAGQHDHTAGGMIVRLDLGEPKLLLHKHKKLGIYLHFGGHIELDETPWQAVIHEIKEESGYDINQLTLLQPKDRINQLTGVVQHPVPVVQLTHKFQEGHYHTDIVYAFTTTEEPTSKPGEDETQELFLVGRDELTKLDSIAENTRETGLFIFDTCLPKWESVDPAEFAA